MKYIKTYEDSETDLKKYSVVHIMDSHSLKFGPELYIIEVIKIDRIRNPLQVRKLCILHNNGFIHKYEYPPSFDMSHQQLLDATQFVKQSDDFYELLDFLKTLSDAQKYNI